MSQASSIEWTDATWNPVRGCTKISPGCAHCYAEVFAERWRGIPGHPYEQGFDLRLVPEKLDEPFRWKNPRRVFVNSMSDLFHENVPDEYIDRIVAVMALCSQHTFQVLTKRAARLDAYLKALCFREVPVSLAITRVPWYDTPQSSPCSVATIEDRLAEGPLENVWWGVSVEDKKYGLARIEELRTTPAAIRFLSIEPLLEDLGEINLQGIHWVIIGGESGPGARSFNLAWARSIVAQCRAAAVPCFVKQLGAKPFSGSGDETWWFVRDRKGGNPSEWPTDLQIREYPA